MTDPLEQLSDSDLQALSKNDMESMSDAGLKIVAASGKGEEPPADEPFMHKAIRNVLPMAGTVLGGLGAGALATPETLGVGAIPAAMAGAAAGNTAGAEGAAWLNHKIYGDAAPTYNSVDDLKRVAGEAVSGAGAELGGQVIGKGLGMAANSAYIKPYLDEAGNLIVNGMNKLGQYVGGNAEKMALKATGATGVQASKFSPGTGRMLLDEGHVAFGRSQEGVADSVAGALDETGKTIGKIIDDLNEQGATGNRQELLNGLQSKIDELKGQTSQANVVKQIKGIMENVAEGPETPDIATLQADKQGYQSMTNWTDPEQTAAKAAASDVYKNAVLDTGAATDFKSAKALSDANKKYSELLPVADASGRRAATVNQSPVGGFLDATSAAAGAVAGGPVTALTAPIARRSLTSRLPSTMASTANSLSKILTNSPQFFGKYTPVLTAAAARGETSLTASAYVLQQRDPAFRQKIMDLNNNGPLSDSDE